MKLFSATIGDWLVPAARSRVYEEMPGRQFGLTERALFPGFVVVLLSIAGLLAIKREELPQSGSASTEVESGPHPLPAAAARAIDLVIAATFVAIVALAEVTPVAESNRLSFDFESRLTFAAVALLAFRLATVRSWAPLRWMRRRFSSGVWIGICLIGIGFLGSLGLNSWFHAFLFDILSQFRGIRAPARWAVIAYAGLAITAALALHAMRRWPRWRAAAAAIAVLVLSVAELYPGRIRWFLAPPERPPVYRWLETAPFRGGVLELPMHHPWFEMAYVFNATAHHRPLVNGYSGYDPLPHREITRASAANPVDPALLGQLEAIGTSLIVVHGDLIEKDRDEPIRAWLREGIRSGRITFVRHFDSLIQGTWVFALTRNEPLAATWRDPEAGDPAGRTPLQNLAIFLDGEEFVMMRNVTGFIDVLEQNTGTDALRVGGWAASPAGIESVELLFDFGEVVHPLEFGTRLDIERRMPWYAGGKVVSFQKSFERWPKGVHLETDLVVRITDRAGRVRHLEQRSLDRERPTP